MSTPGTPRYPVSRRGFLALSAGTGAAVAGLPYLPAHAATSRDQLSLTALKIESADSPLGVDVQKPSWPSRQW